MKIISVVLVGLVLSACHPKTIYVSAPIPKAYTELVARALTPPAVQQIESTPAPRFRFKGTDEAGFLLMDTENARNLMLFMNTSNTVIEQQNFVIRSYEANNKKLKDAALATTKN